MCILSSLLIFLPYLLLFYIISSCIQFFLFILSFLSYLNYSQWATQSEEKFIKKKTFNDGKMLQDYDIFFLLKSYHSRYLSSPLEFLPFNLIAFSFYFFNWHFSPLTAWNCLKSEPPDEKLIMLPPSSLELY